MCRTSVSAWLDERTPNLSGSLESLDDPGLASGYLRKLAAQLKSLGPREVFMNVTAERETFYHRIDIQVMVLTDEGVGTGALGRNAR